MLNLEYESIHASASGWSPVYVHDQLSAISVGFLLQSPDDAVIWRGPKKNQIIHQFLKDVDWGSLDFLLLDTPPGTSDEHLALIQALDSIDGCVLLTTPQEMSLQDVRKEISFCKKVGLKILGLCENMAGFTCPKCFTNSPIFTPVKGAAEQMALDYHIPFLGSIPIDPRIGMSCDLGTSFLQDFPDSPAALAYQSIVANLLKQIKHQDA